MHRYEGGGRFGSIDDDERSSFVKQHREFDPTCGSGKSALRLRVECLIIAVRPSCLQLLNNQKPSELKPFALKYIKMARSPSSNFHVRELLSVISVKMDIKVRRSNLVDT